MKEKYVSKIFLALTMVYVTCLLLSNLTAGKMWAVTPDITLPAAVVLFPLTYILGDVFAEVYGFNNTRTVIWLGFICSFIAVVVYMITVALPYPSFWTGQEAFESVMAVTPRVAAASFLGYLFGEFSNAIILSRMKVATGGKKLWLRTIGSTLVGEGFDSLIFITVSFYGTMDNNVLLSMILYQYIFKVSYEIIFTPVTYWVVGWIKKKEGVDVYDHDERYSLL